MVVAGGSLGFQEIVQLEQERTRRCIHCGGQMQKAIVLVKEAISLALHDLLAIALVCITLAHGTNHRRQRNTSGS